MHILLYVCKNNGPLVEDVVSRLLLIEETLNHTKGSLHKKRFDSANAVGPGGAFDRQLDINVTPNMPPAFLVFQIKYTDPLRKETHSQQYFFEYLGENQTETLRQNFMTPA